MRWTEKQLKILKGECLKGTTYKEIAKILNKSISSITSQVFRRKFVKINKINLLDKNGNWKGDKVSYKGLHRWLRNHKPKPKLCEECKKDSPYDLANISGKYTRKLEDYRWLCRRCHMKSDDRIENFHKKRNLMVKTGIVKRNKRGRFC